DRLLQRLGNLGGDRPDHHVGAAAGRKRHQERDRPRRIGVLCGRRARKQRAAEKTCVENTCAENTCAEKTCKGRNGSASVGGHEHSPGFFLTYCALMPAARTALPRRSASDAISLPKPSGVVTNTSEACACIICAMSGACAA